MYYSASTSIRAGIVGGKVGGGRGGGIHFATPPCWTCWTRPSPLLPPRDKQDGIVMEGGGGVTGASMSRRRKRIKMGLYREIICADTPCGGCLLPARNSSTTGEAAVPGTSSEMTTRSGLVRLWDYHEYEKSLLSYYVSDLFTSPDQIFILYSG